MSANVNDLCKRIPGDEELGKATAPYFAVVLVLFLLAFLGYFVTALVALVVQIYNASPLRVSASAGLSPILCCTFN